MFSKENRPKSLERLDQGIGAPPALPHSFYNPLFHKIDELSLNGLFAASLDDFYKVFNGQI